MSDYDTDILSWSERQASLLRRLAAGERVNEQIDWENVAEEVESVGRSELHRTESLLIQALRHRLPTQIDGRDPLFLPETCPFTLDQLLNN
jgi:Domain of unknown function DUF29